MARNADTLAPTELNTDTLIIVIRAELPESSDTNPFRTGSGLTEGFQNLLEPPAAPIGPVEPSGPVAPVIPGCPTAPEGPGIPVAPVEPEPVAPGPPIRPVAPWGPGIPGPPVGPC